MKTTFKRHYLLSLLLLMMLSAAMVFSLVGCGDENTVGSGEKQFTFEVTGIDGNTETFTVKTDKDIVGEALLDEGLIEGTQGQYGLYVLTVNGERHEYTEDGKYWAFYIDGEYAMTGVDSTQIKEGSVYAFRAE